MVSLRAYLTISQLINRLDSHMLEMTARGECVSLWGGGSHLREIGDHKGVHEMGGSQGFTKRGSREPCDICALILPVYLRLYCSTLFVEECRI